MNQKESGWQAASPLPHVNGSTVALPAAHVHADDGSPGSALQVQPAPLVAPPAIAEHGGDVPRAGEHIGQQWDRIPDELRALPFLIAGPNSKGELKVPMSADPVGRLYAGSSTDSSTWLTFDRASAVATTHGYGIGFVLSDHDPYVVIDLDVKGPHNEADQAKWSTQEQLNRFWKIAQVFDSYVEYSRSAIGLHVIVKGLAGDGARHDGVEAYSRGRFMVCTGNVLIDKPIVERQELLDLLITEIRIWQGKKFKRVELVELDEKESDDDILHRASTAANADKFNDLFAGRWMMKREGFDYESQSEADLALLSIFRFYSKSNEQCRRLFRMSGLGKRAKATKDDRYLDLTLTLIHSRQTAEEAEQAQVLFLQRQKYRALGHGVPLDPATLVPPDMSLDMMMAALVFVSDGTHVAFRDNPQVKMPWREMKALLRSCKTSWTVLDKNGKDKVITKETFELWMDSPEKRTVHTVTFDPGQPEFCASTSGLHALNLYRPRPHVAPEDWQGRVTPFLNHVGYLAPVVAERERFLDWLAHIEQKPGELPHTGYLMIAASEGIGRNTLADILADVWRGHVALSLDLGAVLRDQFNDELSRKFLAVVDEVNEGQQNGMWAIAEKLKSFITAPVRNMNPKFGRRYTEVNVARLLVFSNHESALPLRETDRRLNVIRNPSTPNDASYYSELRRVMRDPLFIASVREWLRRRDISRFNPGERATMNEAKLAVVEATRTEAAASALDLVAHWPRDCITADDFCRELFGDEEHGKDKTAQLKFRAAEAGIERWKANGSGKIRPLGKYGGQTKVWILRNHECWAQASSDAILHELNRQVQES